MLLSLLLLTALGRDTSPGQGRLEENRCIDDEELACTGIDDPTVRPYALGEGLWVDGLEKARWLALPAGTRIDTADPEEWRFPVGTRVWKELREDGKRIETRFIRKEAAGSWTFSTYQWSEDGKTARRVRNGATLPSGHQIPAETACPTCHDGRIDTVLGIDAVTTSLPGTTGVSLNELRSWGVVDAATVGVRAPGTQAQHDALTWLHVNCGSSCHNESPDKHAPPGLELKLRAADGTLAETAALRTALGQPTTTITEDDGAAVMRIVPGDPDASAVVFRAEARGDEMQMPPVFTTRVDTRGVALLRAFVAGLERTP